MGYYGYESYRLPADGGTCGCSSYGDYAEPLVDEDDDDPADVSVFFSRKVLFYENEYYDEVLGYTVPARSDETVVLSCTVNGGPRGGVLHVEHENLDKLSRIGGGVLPSQDCNTDQRFELDADGTSRMKKFQYVGERMTNGVYRTWRQN